MAVVDLEGNNGVEPVRHKGVVGVGGGLQWLPIGGVMLAGKKGTIKWVPCGGSARQAG